MGLSKAFGSPNGAMRRGWNGITISRDTIHIDGIELGYKNPVFFERHAVGGEYGAGWNEVGKGTLLTTYLPADGEAPFVVDKRDLTDDHNVCVVYHNPYDNVEELARLFFQRCLDANITPYVVTKKTVFKWQEGFWETMKRVFDADFKTKFEEVRHTVTYIHLTSVYRDCFISLLFPFYRRVSWKDREVICSISFRMLPPCS